VFENEHLNKIDDIVAEAIEEANYYFGYKRYLNKHVDKDSDYFEDYYEDHYNDGMELVNEAGAAKQSLLVLSRELADLDAEWAKRIAFTIDDQKRYIKDRKAIGKKIVGEAFRIVWIRRPFEAVLQGLELMPRRKYQRKPEELLFATEEDE
jgi:hypothetical protein